jgi:hypothetical protein
MLHQYGCKLKVGNLGLRNSFDGYRAKVTLLFDCKIGILFQNAVEYCA